ncbi:hypothetical protein C8J57DRAFT_1255961 [Mycena rebaudengoi]|nr:hypothetical protein C8J57DRAFT_1255961 [Mycena rebaudengoi]
MSDDENPPLPPKTMEDILRDLMAVLPALVAQAVAALPTTPLVPTTSLQPALTPAALPTPPVILGPPLIAQPPPLIIPTPTSSRLGDLSKLDSRYRNKEDRQILSLGGVQLSYTDAAPRDYKSLNAIVVPLSEYFAILCMYAQPTGQAHWVARQFWRYNVHLSKIAAEYEFAAVLEYHMEFFPTPPRRHAAPWGLLWMGTSRRQPHEQHCSMTGGSPLLRPNNGFVKGF